MKKQIFLSESYIRARIIGIILVIIGVAILVNPTDLNIKISVTLILIGLFMIFMITEKSISKKTSDAQIEGNTTIIKEMIKELNLKGNAIFLPKSSTRSEERVLIPPNESGVIKIPNTIYDNVFLADNKGNNLGISIPPAGIKLLDEIEKDGKFKNAKFEDIDEKLQLFVGMNLLKSVSFKQHKNGWYLEIEKLDSSDSSNDLQNQYPCPVCSAVITAITRELNQIIRIYKTSQNGNKIVYHLNFIKRKAKQEK